MQNPFSGYIYRYLIYIQFFSFSMWSKIFRIKKKWGGMGKGNKKGDISLLFKIASPFYSDAETKALALAGSTGSGLLPSPNSLVSSPATF